MDAFVTFGPQKKDPGPTLHDEEIERLRRYVAEGRSVFVCGPTGSGKTFVVERVLDPSNSVELTVDKKATDFEGTRAHVFIDGYDTSVPQHRHLVDRGRAIVATSKDVHLLPHTKLIVMPRRSPEQIARLAPLGTDPAAAFAAAQRSRGNIRDFFDYLVRGSDTKDIFKTSKELIAEIMCTPGPFDYSQTVHEHGHVCDVIHGNYLSARHGDPPAIMESLSLADVYDTAMYRGAWELMPYYIAAGIAGPKYHLGPEGLKEGTLKPGSAWTKYSNYKMRHQKLVQIQSRHSTRLGPDELGLVRRYAAEGDLGPMEAYGLTTSDLDVMNHLALGNKMRPNEIVRLKKKMRLKTNDGI